MVARRLAQPACEKPPSCVRSLLLANFKRRSLIAGTFSEASVTPEEVIARRHSTREEESTCIGAGFSYSPDFARPRVLFARARHGRCRWLERGVRSALALDPTGFWGSSRGHAGSARKRGSPAPGA